MYKARLPEGAGRVNPAEMKTPLVAVAVAVAVAAVTLGLAEGAGPKSQARYTTKYDNVNVGEILRNERLFKKYYNCLIGQGSCTNDAKVLKDAIPDALATRCSKCSERQRKGTQEVFKFLIEKQPQRFATLERIYDPKGEYRKRYQAELAKAKADAKKG